MRRWVVRILLVVVVLVLVAGVAGYWYARPLLLTGTGYAAHNACALTHLADRPADEDLPPNPLVPYLRVDTSEDGASASVLGVLARQRAWFVDGVGCTLGDGPPDVGPLTPVEAGEPLPGAATSPTAVDELVAEVFGDDLDDAARDALGTRAVVVVHRGEVVAERYADGFTETTPQLGWSMSKSVANLLTGTLVLEGLVEPDDAALRPEWTDERGDITVDDLMRGTSGLKWDETYDLGTPITRMLYLEDDMAGYVAGLPLAHTPGNHQQYSSGSTNLLCSVLAERAGGGADLPRRKLFAPLGLASAVWEVDGAGTPVCSSYLWATPRDWATIGQFVLQDGVWDGERLLPEGWLRNSTTVEPVDSTEEAGYAAGWWVNRDADGAAIDQRLPVDTVRALGHDGQRLYIVPSAELVVVRMGFSPGVGGDELRTDQLVKEFVAELAGR